jgi:pimeloyl-ACP methyl ester carboxylesterase
MSIAHERTGRGPPLLLVHGIGARRESWAGVVPRLAERREVIAIDLPGFGESAPFPPGQRSGPAALTEAVASFIAEQGLERPHAGGNSLGGRIALELARRGLVRSATTLSPWGFANPRETEWVRTSLASTRRFLGAARPLLPWLAGSAAARTAIGLQYFARPWRIPPRRARELLEGFADCPGFGAALEGLVSERRFTGGEQIGVPVTIGWGDRDALLFPRQAGRAARLIPMARLRLLRGLGHMPTWDDAGQVAHVLLEGSRAP